MAVERDHSDPEVIINNSINSSHSEPKDIETCKDCFVDNVRRHDDGAKGEVAMETEGEEPMDVSIETRQTPIVFDDPPGIKPLSINLLRRASADTVDAHDEEGIGIAGEILNRSSLRGPGNLNVHRVAGGSSRRITDCSGLPSGPTYGRRSGHKGGSGTNRTSRGIGYGHRARGRSDGERRAGS